MTPTEYAKQHRLPDCPVCNEPAGMPCRTPIGRVRNPHYDRLLGLTQETPC